MLDVDINPDSARYGGLAEPAVFDFGIRDKAADAADRVLYPVSGYKTFILSAVTLFLVLSFSAGDSSAADKKDDKKAWRISGRVLTLNGDLLAGSSVELDTEGDSSGKKTTRTNPRGDYQFEIEIKSQKSKQTPHLKGTLKVVKDGYQDGREDLELYPSDADAVIDIVLDRLDPGDERVPIAGITSMLAPRLKANAEKNCAEEAGHPEFLLGYEALRNEKKAEEAFAAFRQSAARSPECFEGQLLLELALMNAGRWGGAARQFEDATIIADLLEVNRTELDLLQGVLESRRGRFAAAAGFFKNVLEADEKDATALQEMGRIALMTKQWAAADQFIAKAIAAGADDEARLMQARALLELGEVVGASEEMNRYVAGRNLKNLPLTARMLHEKVQNQLSLASKGTLQSIITQPIEDLMEIFPELQGLQPAADQASLTEILDKTGQEVENFFQNISNTASTEKVRQERLKKDGKPDVSLDQEYLYLMLTQTREPGLGIEEYRSTEDGRSAARNGLKQGLML
ncbi:MAG: hypothetical protein LBP68_02135, partial [Acidobacteriota bacterium]|nr:hypothetical protein [Acidobacteriota bacterium]